MARVRSPSFPFIGLEKAIARAREFYYGERMGRVHVSVAPQHWSYNEKSSGSIQTLAALVAFGLMSYEGRKEKRSVALTEAARVILLGSDGPRQQTIQECALKPNIHKTLWEHFEEKIPSDGKLRDYLLFDHKPPFNENVVDQFILQFRATLKFSKLTSNGSIPEENQDINSQPDDSPTPLKSSGTSEPLDEPAVEPSSKPQTLHPVPIADGASETPPLEILSFRLSQGSRAELKLSGPITGEAIDKLIAFLNLEKDTYPEK